MAKLKMCRGETVLLSYLGEKSLEKGLDSGIWPYFNIKSHFANVILKAVHAFIFFQCISSELWKFWPNLFTDTQDIYEFW